MAQRTFLWVDAIQGVLPVKNKASRVVSPYLSVDKHFE
jgi:hypothetical protein